jgi:adenylosuccinate synthase
MAKVVLGAMFGDEGKGAFVNHLADDESIIVRFNGGQQAGHTVIHNGIKHTFSNFGAGALKGAPTFFSEHCTFYPKSALIEKKILDRYQANTKLYLHPFAKLTIPHDVIANRAKSLGKKNTVGLGVGQTMKRNKEFFKIIANDILHKEVLREKIKNAAKYYYLDLEVPFDFEEFYDYILQVGYEISSDILLQYDDEDIIFEGAQGILLDMDHGFFPNVTYSNTTVNNLSEYYMLDFDIYYMTRCYQTRHGYGWMSNEKPISLINNEHEINVENDFQGKFRIGEFDLDLLKHAIGINRLVIGNKELSVKSENLVVTCLDQRPDFDINYIKDNIDINVIPFKGA